MLDEVVSVKRICAPSPSSTTPDEGEHELVPAAIDVRQGRLAVELVGVRNFTVEGTDTASPIDSEINVVTPLPVGRAEAEPGSPTAKNGESTSEIAAMGRQGNPTLSPLSHTQRNYVSVQEV